MEKIMVNATPWGVIMRFPASDYAPNRFYASSLRSKHYPPKTAPKRSRQIKNKTRRKRK